MAIEITGPQRELREQEVRREQLAPELRKHQTQRRNRGADGDVHQVKRRVAKSRLQEAAATTQVSRGPVRRWRRANALAQLLDPPGYSLCWIRRHGPKHGDNAGLIAAIDEGWEFCRKGDFPEHVLPTQRFSDHGEIIGNDASVLMKLHEELKAQRDAYYADRRDTATRAVNRKNPGLPEANDKMPLVEDVNQVSTSMGRMRRDRKEA